MNTTARVTRAVTDADCLLKPSGIRVVPGPHWNGPRLSTTGFGESEDIALSLPPSVARKFGLFVCLYALLLLVGSFPLLRCCRDLMLLAAAVVRDVRP